MMGLEPRFQLQHPGKNNSIYFFGTGLQYDIGGNIFTFGSNEAGRHGKGAAKTAVDEYGAIYGIGYGLMNRSFAIPTKNAMLSPLSIDQIGAYVYEFIKFTREHPEMGFYLTPIGTGYSGYQHHQIAPLFRGVENCWIPHIWQHHLATY